MSFTNYIQNKEDVATIEPKSSDCGCGCKGSGACQIPETTKPDDMFSDLPSFNLK